MTEENINPSKRSFFGITLSDTILLAVLPFFGYLISYAYLAGKFSFFHLPLELISVSIVDIFICSGGILAVLFVALITIDLIFNAFPKGFIYPLVEHINFVIQLFLILFPFLFLNVRDPDTYVYVLLLGFLIVTSFILALKRKKDKGAYIQRKEMSVLKAAEKNSTMGELLRGSVINEVVSFIGFKQFNGRVH